MELWIDVLIDWYIVVDFWYILIIIKTIKNDGLKIYRFMDLLVYGFMDLCFDVLIDYCRLLIHSYYY